MKRVLVWVAAAFLGGCASTGVTPQPFPGAAAPPRVQEPAPAGGRGAGYAIAGTALAMRGVPYRNGGSDPGGFDCSGLVQYVFQQHGVRVPRSVTDQYRLGRDVPPDALEAGDLVFFSTKARGPSHVGIAIGGDAFVHAPAANGVVRVERIGTTYWWARFVGARRVSGP